MRKTNQIKFYEQGLDSVFAELFREFLNSDLVKRKDLPSYRGIYAFYENGKPIYVGRSNKILNRIQWHSRASSGSESASFAFNLVKGEYAKKAEIHKRRKELMEVEEFFEIFTKHKLNLTNLYFRCLRVENDILQTIFEPYLA